MFRSVNINKITAFYLLSTLMLFSWLFSFSTILLNINMLILFALIVLPFLKKGKASIVKNDFFLLLLFLFFILINIVSFGINYNTIINLFFLSFSISILVFFVRIKKENDETFKFLFSDFFYRFLNFYLIVNVIIIHIQSVHPGFLMLGNDWNFDNITGFFGPGASHTITIFFACVICMILERIIENKNNRVTRILYLAIILIAMISTISINDNTASVFIVPATILLYLINKYGLRINMVFKLIIILVILSLVFFIMYENNEDIKSFVDSRVINKINAYLFRQNNSMTQIGFGDERIRAFEFTILHGDGAFLGKGFSCSLDDVTKLDGYYEYSGERKTYVGISDISGITYLGGIWFYILWCVVLSCFFMKLSTKTQEDMTFKRFLMHFFSVLCFTVYTTFFRSPNMTIMVSIFALMLSNSTKNQEGMKNE